MNPSLSKFSLVLVASLCGAAVAAPALAATIDLTATIRDFRGAGELGGHPDFESGAGGNDPGIVQPLLGADKKPVYAGLAGNPTTHGQTAFDQWYRDTPGVNLTTTKTLTLTETFAGSGVYSFSSGSYFPINGELFGNTPGWGANYHFTTEIHGQFTYQGTETFSFTGDDDVWAYINGQLVVDLGGVHGAAGASVTLSSLAGTLGLVVGQSYDFDFFHAERQTSGSNFTFTTSILLADAPLPEPGTLAMLGLGLAGLGFARRRRAA